MRATEQIVFDIRQITKGAVEDSDNGVLECSIDGTASGIPGAFIEALDRVDPTCSSSESLHKLLVEYANAAAFFSQSVIPRTVVLRFSSGQTFVTAK